jgi:hypothetical protein
MILPRLLFSPLGGKTGLPLEAVGLDEVVDMKRNPYTVLVYNIGMD